MNMILDMKQRGILFSIKLVNIFYSTSFVTEYMSSYIRILPITKHTLLRTPCVRHATSQKGATLSSVVCQRGRQCIVNNH